jgi:predicted dehydrogenase
VASGAKEIRIGMIGYGFMGKAHSHAYRSVPFFFDTKTVPVLQSIAGRNEENTKAAAQKMGWKSYETDWHRLIERDDIDVIDIVTPNYMHEEMAVAAAKAGKHVICEKPLATTVEKAQNMLSAVEKSGVIHMVCHNYRFAPAVQFAKKIIDSGKLGKIHHFRGQYLQDWILDSAKPMDWKLQKDITGSGALGDIGSHIIDLARFLVGEIKDVVGMMETFVKERPLHAADHNQHEGKASVDVDDAAAFMTRFENGALGVFEATRFAGGHRNGNQFEINGEKGSIRWDFENMNYLDVYFQTDDPGFQGFRKISCTEELHPFASAYWPPGHIIGYEHTFINLIAELIKGIEKGFSPSPNFYDGLRNQKVLAAVEESVSTRGWVTISE